MSRASDIKAIHAIARSSGMDEETRRSVYERVTGCGTLAVMTDAQVGAVAVYFRSLGGAPRPQRKTSSKAHVRKVYALWWRLCDAGLVAKGARSGAARREALNAFLNERFAGDLGGAQTDIEFLSVALAAKATEAFKAIARRARRS